MLNSCLVRNTYKYDIFKADVTIIQYMYSNAMGGFSSAFSEQEAIHTWDNMLPLGLQIHLSHRISDLLIGSKGIFQLWGTFALITAPCSAPKLVKALSAFIGLSLIDKPNWGRTLRECYKCQTVHTKDQHSPCTQWCIVPRWLSVNKCTSERKVCAFLFTRIDANATVFMWSNKKTEVFLLDEIMKILNNYD